MALYRTRDGDRLDSICFAYYGQTQQAVELVLEANAGLADLGPVFSSGVLIELPELTQLNQKNSLIRLWS